jgi:hypothetical protein
LDREQRDNESEMDNTTQNKGENGKYVDKERQRDKDRE